MTTNISINKLLLNFEQILIPPMSNHFPFPHFKPICIHFNLFLSLPLRSYKSRTQVLRRLGLLKAEMTYIIGLSLTFLAESLHLYQHQHC